MFSSIASCTGERATAASAHAYNASAHFRIAPVELRDVQSLVSSSSAALLLGVWENDLALIDAKAASVVAAGPDLEVSQKHSAQGGRVRHMRCDFARSELPLDLNPPPQVIVAHYAFKVATDLQLSYRAMRCAYPNATWYVTSTEPPGATWHQAFCPREDPADEGEAADEGEKGDEGESGAEAETTAKAAKPTKAAEPNAKPAKAAETNAKLAKAAEMTKVAKAAETNAKLAKAAETAKVNKANSYKAAKGRRSLGEACTAWDAPGMLFPSPFSLTKFAMADTKKLSMAEVENHYQKRWLLPDSAASLGMRTALRRSGLLSMIPDETAVGGRFSPARSCHGAPSLDAARMLHDCTSLLAPEPQDPSASGSTSRESAGKTHDEAERAASLRRQWATRDDATAAREANTVEWFNGLTGSGTAYSTARNEFFVSRLPNRSRVLELGCGAQQLGARLLSSRCGVHYCPTDAVPRAVPYRAAVCDLNAGAYPLSLHPPPTHIVAQGVLVYVLDRYTFMRALRCAYPDATWLLSAATGLGNDLPHAMSVRAELTEAIEREFGLHAQTLFSAVGEEEDEENLLELTPIRERSLSSLGCRASAGAKAHDRKHEGACYASLPCGGVQQHSAAEHAQKDEPKQHSAVHDMLSWVG